MKKEIKKETNSALLLDELKWLWYVIFFLFTFALCLSTYTMGHTFGYIEGTVDVQSIQHIQDHNNSSEIVSYDCSNEVELEHLKCETQLLNQSIQYNQMLYNTEKYCQS